MRKTEGGKERKRGKEIEGKKEGKKERERKRGREREGEKERERERENVILMPSEELIPS